VSFAPKFFAAVTKRLADNAGLKNVIGAKLTFVAKDPDAHHTFELGGRSELVLTIADADLPALAAGNLRALYQHGKLRIDGDISVAHRLGFLKGVL
jgi:3-hydroxyacyl-CoA dehydrogenase/3a,7a,12a-trihydroxy-5b-cholest-24-enoyl-CoA hydratase